MSSWMNLLHGLPAGAILPLRRGQRTSGEGFWDQIDIAKRLKEAYDKEGRFVEGELRA